MLLRKLCLCLCICLFGLPFPGNAQRNFGVAGSEWSDMNSLYINPANIAGSHEKITVFLFSVGAAVDNNLGKFDGLGNIGNALNNNSGQSSVFTNSGRNTFSMMIPSAEIRGPGVLLKINDKQSIALTTRVRVMNQLDNFDQSLFNTITNPKFVPNGDNTVVAKNFNWTAHLWSEVGLTYGVSVIDNGSSQLKLGVTLRYLGGIGYLSLKGNNLDLDYNTGRDSFYASHSDLEYTSNIISTKSALSNGISSSDLLSNLLGSSQGSGIGADVGIVYAFNPGGTDQYSDQAILKQGYRVKLSASLTDIGSINYKAQNNSTVNVTGNGYLTGKGLSNNVKNADDFKNYLVSQGFNADTSTKATKLYLPTAMVIGADYHIYKQYFVNATYVGNLENRQNFGNGYYNQVTVTPRYDTKLFTVGLPITYGFLTSSMKLGIGIRVAGFFIGSDDMLAVLGKSANGVGVYVGGYIPLFTKDKNAG